MDEVNDFESTPQVACSLSPIETAILICIVAYIIIKSVKKFFAHRFSSSQRSVLVENEAFGANTKPRVEISTEAPKFHLGPGDTFGRSRKQTSGNSTVTGNDTIKVGDVVKIKGGSQFEYYVVKACNQNGNIAITNSSPQVTLDYRAKNLELVKSAEDNQVTIEKNSVFQCTRNMSVASVKNPLGLKIFIEGESIMVTQDLKNGMVEGNRFGEEDSYYFPALLLEEVEEDDY